MQIRTKLRIRVDEREKINTIKLVRWLSGILNFETKQWDVQPWGLKEAKDFVENTPVVNHKRTFLFDTYNSMERVHTYLRNEFLNSSVFVEICNPLLAARGYLDGVPFSGEQIQKIADTYFGILSDNRVPPTESMKRVESLLVGLGIKVTKLSPMVKINYK